ncbi:S8 family serine peptidase [Caldimonas brevitalea]|uniref:Serine protease n=1 Tax=Caldimonas brevitalea TaxID=413882 RepID=A0A0G3BCH7_9BURK|nr:S8 family serine peptidase [Caldimonas brevitalea]AKJ27022.1 serine protease [Caldimonas brevitalea]
MRFLSPFLSVAALCALSLSPASAAPAAPDAGLAYGVLVKLKSSDATTLVGREAPLAQRERLAAAFRGKSFSLGEVSPLDAEAHVVRWARPLSRVEADRLVQELRQDPNVEWAAPNVRERRLQAAPNDPYFNSRQWWLSTAPDIGSRGVPNIARSWGVPAPGAATVAVLDTGLVRNHEDLLGTRFDTGYDLVSNGDGLAGDGDGRDADFNDPGDGVVADQCADGSAPEDSSWHGTKIAGIIGANSDNGVGVAGANWGARVVSVRIAGKCGALVSDIIAGMRWAAGLKVDNLPLNPHPARIINLSFGGSETDCEPYRLTIDDLHRAGAVIIAAGGNEDGRVSRPARCAGVLAVGAVNRDGFKATYANLGPQIDITTVGGDSKNSGRLGPTVGDDGLYTASKDEPSETDGGDPKYGFVFGTSFSTPVVAGVASRMLAVNPQLTIDQLVHGLQSTSRPHVTSGVAELQQCSVDAPQGRCYCTTATCGAGLLDAEAAMAYAKAPAASPPTFYTPGSGDGDGGGGGDDDGGGGGALDARWLLGLAAIAWLARFGRGLRRRT